METPALCHVHTLSSDLSSFPPPLLFCLCFTIPQKHGLDRLPSFSAPACSSVLSLPQHSVQALIPLLGLLWPLLQLLWNAEEETAALPCCIPGTKASQSYTALAVPEECSETHARL